MKINLIYALRNCANDTYFYIGKTSVGISRPLTHLKKSHNKNVRIKVEEIEDSNNLVAIDILEENIKIEDLSNREKYWIEYYFNIYDLLNVQSLPDEKLNFSKDVDLEDVNYLLNKLNNISEIIFKKRIYLGITQQELANKSNINRGTLSLIESGFLCNTKTLINILENLNTSIKEKNKVRKI